MGNLGIGVNPVSPTSVQLGATAVPERVVTGAGATFVVLANGSIVAWGGNGAGVLGQGDTEDRGDVSGRPLPMVDLGTGRTVVKVGAGVAHACALLDDGSVK